MSKLCIFAMLVCFSGVIMRQDLKGQVLRDTGDVFVEISSVISSMPGDSGDDFAFPTVAELATWGSVLQNLFTHNYDEAADSAAIIDYDLIEFVDTTAGDAVYYVLKNNASNYWGTYVYNPDYCRSLVIQSPHPKKDYNTGKEGVYVFRETESLFFCMSGTSRCNHSGFSTCSGTTSVCSGSSESYRVSDLAHVLHTVFQSTTDTLLHFFPNVVFLQLHGFAKLPSDPFIILSNGTQISPAIDPIATFKTKLENEDSLFVDSIKVAHFDLNWTRLRGFSNVQVRLVNGSVSPCDSNSTMTNGQFIHMEQEKTRLRDDSTGWKKVSNALKGTFACTPFPVRLLYFYAERSSNGVVLCHWATAYEFDNDYFVIERSSNVWDWQEIGVVKGAGTTFSEKHYIFEDRHSLGNAYYRLRQVDVDGLHWYSDVVFVAGEDMEMSSLIYPNPAKDFLYIRAVGRFSEVRILNQLGQEVYLDEFVQTIDLRRLEPGIYYLFLEDGKRQEFFRFVKVSF